MSRKAVQVLSVEVPASTRHVELLYCDRASLLGAMIFLAARLLCAGGGMWARRLEPQQ